MSLTEKLFNAKEISAWKTHLKTFLGCIGMTLSVWIIILLLAAIALTYFVLRGEYPLPAHTRYPFWYYLLPFSPLPIGIAMALWVNRKKLSRKFVLFKPKTRDYWIHLIIISTCAFAISVVYIWVIPFADLNGVRSMFLTKVMHSAEFLNFSERFVEVCIEVGSALTPIIIPYHTDVYMLLQTYVVYTLVRMSFDKSIIRTL